MGITTFEPRGMLRLFRSTNAPSNWTPISPWPMPVWVLCTAIWDRPVWRQRISRKPTTCAIGSANGKNIRISALYYDIGYWRTGAGQSSLRTWAKSYPQDVVPPGNLAVIYAYLGQYREVLISNPRSQRLAPDATGYANLTGTYLALNRLDDAQKTIEEAQKHNLAGDFLHLADLSTGFPQ